MFKLRQANRSPPRRPLPSLLQVSTPQRKTTAPGRRVAARPQCSRKHQVPGHPILHQLRQRRRLRPRPLHRLRCLSQFARRSQTTPPAQTPGLFSGVMRQSGYDQPDCPGGLPKTKACAYPSLRGVRQATRRDAGGNHQQQRAHQGASDQRKICTEIDRSSLPLTRDWTPTNPHEPVGDDSTIPGGHNQRGKCPMQNPTMHDACQP